MHIDNLKYFYDIATTKNISFVAKKSHISQSALSQQLIKLEDKLDTKLLERSNKGVNLTPEGEIALKYTKTILTSYTRMLEELNAYKNNKKTVNIYSLSYVKNFILPGFIGDFKKNFKNYKINLSSIETPFNEESLNSSSFDIIISSEKFLREDIVCQKLFDDEFVAIASPKFNIKDEYSIEEILTLPIIIVNNNTNISKYVEDKLSSFNSNSDSLNVLFTTDSPLTALNALIVNEAISFAPKTVAQLYAKDHNLKEVKISNFTLSYSMYLLVNRSFYMDEKVFIDTLKKKIKGFLK